MSDDARDPGPDPEVGSLGEEAARLFGVLSGWARDQAGEAGDGLSGFAAHAGAAVRDLDEHLATGSAECTVCPVCRTVHAVRQLSPEVKAHLTSAVTSLAQAVAALMATPDPRGDRTSDVEHIDLDDGDAGAADEEWPEDR
ncbi:hypothetical protein SAMN04489844_4224 [Nocardioides exalbidus]|uniref:Uncharacterized protein n=1 Tax=Nocardioides exalbidus TaxID=402596 RepID=A0A1H4ZY26_9ACTN|nr:hypothetical protein [Nocardioides exalbidus]SED34588.1 hypothetical protein SAMN04489844_4224 [Nocardioides exalbidus]